MLSRRLSTTPEAEVRADARDEAIAHVGPPEIVTTDRGSQVTAFAWTDLLRKAHVRISMDGKGRVLDTVFIERLRRSMTDECVYLRARETRSEARAGLRGPGSTSTPIGGPIPPATDDRGARSAAQERRSCTPTRSTESNSGPARPYPGIRERLSASHGDFDLC